MDQPKKTQFEELEKEQAINKQADELSNIITWIKEQEIETIKELRKGLEKDEEQREEELQKEIEEDAKSAI